MSQDRYAAFHSLRALSMRAVAPVHFSGPLGCVCRANSVSSTYQRQRVAGRERATMREKQKSSSTWST